MIEVMLNNNQWVVLRVSFHEEKLGNNDGEEFNLWLKNHGYWCWKDGIIKSGIINSFNIQD